MTPNSSPPGTSEQSVGETYRELFHYADWNGLKGIWESGIFRATDYRYLNDSQEIILIKTKLVEEISRILTIEVNKKMKFVDHNYEHTFPLLIDKTTQDIIVIDALNHVTKIVKNPAREQMSYKKVESIKIKNRVYYICGYYRNTKKINLVELVDWWSKTPCQYTFFVEKCNPLGSLQTIPAIHPQETD